MRVIGVRQLKASLSETLRSVGTGERVRVTSRGRPVADIVPPETVTVQTRMDDLVAQGRLTRASKPHPEHPPPLADAEILASDLVLADREDGR